MHILHICLVLITPSPVSLITYCKVPDFLAVVNE